MICLRRSFLAVAAGIFALLLSGSVYAWGPDEFYFIVAADPQIWWHQEETAGLEKTISVINGLKPAFVVVCGDLVSRDNDPRKMNAERDDKMAQAYLDVVKKLHKDIKMYSAAGNHDVSRFPSKATHQWYAERFGDLWYSFTYGKSLFIVLESNTMISPEGEPDFAVEQMRWLETQLKKSKKNSHIFVFMHHPIFIKDIDEEEGYHNMPRELRQRLLDLFTQYNVEMVFSGHLHHNTYARYKNIELISTASCCHSEPSGLRIVKVTPDKVYDRFYSFGEMPGSLDEMTMPEKKEQ